jgi:WD40 repeat protein
MKYTSFFLVAITTGVMGACLLGSAAKYASSMEMISVSSCPSLTMSASGSTSSFSPSSAPTLPGTVEDTECLEEPSISSSSAPLSPLSPSAPTVRLGVEDPSFGCSTRARRSKNWGNLVACKVYANLQDEKRERLAVIYRCNAHGCIGALIDIESGEQTALLDGFALESQVSFYGMEVTADNTTLIIAAGETVQLFDAQTGQSLGSIPVSGKQITRLLCRGIDNFFLGFSDGTVGIGTCKETKWAVTFLPYESVNSMAVSCGGSLNAFAQDTGNLLVFDTEKEAYSQIMNFSNESKITVLAIEKQKLVVACGRKVFIWNLNGSKSAFQEYAVQFDFEVSHIAIGPNGSSIAFALTDNTVHLYEAAHKKQVIKVGEKILDLCFEENQLKIYSRNNRLIRRVYTIDAKEDFSLVPSSGIYHEPSMFASYGKLYAVYGQRSGDLFCVSYRPKEYGVDHFLQKMSEKAHNTFIFPSEFLNEEQELWEHFSLFTKRACAQKFPFLIESELQQQFLKAFIARMKNGANTELYVFDHAEEALFRSLPPVVQEVLLTKYPLLIDDGLQSALAYQVESKNISIVNESSFMELSPDIRQYLRGKNQRLIVSNSRLVRGFWHMIDAIGLGRFSRRSVRIGTGALILAALGVGAWRVWKKYHSNS